MKRVLSGQRTRLDGAATSSGNVGVDPVPVKQARHLRVLPFSRGRSRDPADPASTSACELCPAAAQQPVLVEDSPVTA